MYIMCVTLKEPTELGTEGCYSIALPTQVNGEWVQRVWDLVALDADEARTSYATALLAATDWTGYTVT